jgi:hypothetical protein
MSTRRRWYLSAIGGVTSGGAPSQSAGRSLFGPPQFWVDRLSAYVNELSFDGLILWPAQQPEEDRHASMPEDRESPSYPIRPLRRVISLPISRSQTTELATSVQRSQSPALNPTVANARCRNGM